VATTAARFDDLEMGVMGLTFTVIPPEGALPLRFGMTQAQVRRVLDGAGRFEDVTAPGGLPQLHLVDDDQAVDLYTVFTAGDQLFTIEFWRPQASEAPMALVFDGINLFDKPADETIAILRSRGHEVDTADEFFPNMAGHQIRFNRDEGEDRDDNGLATYFELIMIAPEHYREQYTNVHLPTIVDA
jgi:hypothetical protein